MIDDLSNQDLLLTRHFSLFSDLDERVLIDLYMPLVGAKALGVYFSLRTLETETPYKHEILFRNCQVSPGEWVQCLHALEAVALVGSYVGEQTGKRLVIYTLYAPQSPKAFFADPLYAGTLQKYIGKNDCVSLAKKYDVNAVIPDNFRNVSDNFISYFSPDFNDKSYGKSLLKSGEETAGTTPSDFNAPSFYSHLATFDPRYSSSLFSQEEMFKISRLADLYGYSSEAMADFVNEGCLNFKGQVGRRLDYKKLVKECEDNLSFTYLKKSEPKAATPVHGSTALAKSLRSMQELTPTQFLARLQKGNRPAPSDLNLLEELTVEMGLPKEVCNALILYVLSRQNNTLPKAYTEKIAAALVREGLTTALDTMNYFAGNKKKDYKKASLPSEEKVSETPSEKEEDSSEEKNYDEVVDSLQWKKGS